MRLPRASDSSRRRLAWRRQAPLLVGLLAAAGIVAVGGATAKPGGGSIDSKRAEAQQVIAQIDAMDAQLEQRVQAYDDATYRLAKIQRQLKTTARELGYARTSLRHAQKTLQQRAVALYTQPQDDSTVSVILGATSLDDLMNRLDTAKRVSRQDAQVVQSVTHFRDTVTHHQAVLAKARVDQQRTVAKRAAERGTVERELAARQSYLAHVKGEIAQLIAQQRAAELARQARGAAAARARLAVAAAAATPPQPRPRPTPSATDQTATIVDSGATGGAPASGHGDAGRGARAAQELGKPYSVGGRRAEQLRLLGPRDVRVRADRDLAAALELRAGRDGRAGRLRRPAAGRSRLLQRERPRRDLHRRRQHRPRAAHRRRRLGDQPRRSTAASTPPAASSGRRCAARGESAWSL